MFGAFQEGLKSSIAAGVSLIVMFGDFLVVGPKPEASINLVTLIEVCSYSFLKALGTATLLHASAEKNTVDLRCSRSQMNFVHCSYLLCCHFRRDIVASKMSSRDSLNLGMKK